MAYADSRLQRGYVQKETAAGAVPNNAGVATLAGTDCFLFESLDMNGTQATNRRPDKTGSLGQLAGTPGRYSATWEMKCSLAGSGAAGTKTDIDEFFEAAFGKAATVTAGTSVVYALDDAAPSATIWDFNRPSTVNQRCIAGAIVKSMKVEFGADFAHVTFSGEGRSIVESALFASLDTAAKSGLTAFPAEPASPTTNGTAVAGYKGTITLDGQAYTTLKSGSIELTVGRELAKDDWGLDLPGGASNGERVVKLDLSLDDDDSATLAALKAKARLKTPFDATITIGIAAGNTHAFACKNIQLDNPSYDTSGTRRKIKLAGEAHMSNMTTKDELTYTQS